MKKLCVILVAACLCLPVAAQPDKAKMEEIHAKKIAYIAEVMHLTPTEAQAFWPLYNELGDKMAVKRKRSMQLEKLLHEAPQADCEKVNDELVNLKLEMAQIRKAYYERYKTVLSAEKISLLFRAEMDFKHQLLKSIEKK